MTNREHFIAAIDDNPSDQVTRLIFADWLEEQGEYVLAAGLRWMVENNKWPGPDVWSDDWVWFMQSPYQISLVEIKSSCTVPNELRLRSGSSASFTTQGIYEKFKTRHKAEVALAEALWESGVTKVVR